MLSKNGQFFLVYDLRIFVRMCIRSHNEACYYTKVMYKHVQFENRKPPM